MDYKSIIREKANKLTQHLTISDTPIDPMKLIENYYNVTLLVEDLCGEEGYTLYDKKRNRYKICIDTNSYNKGRINFTIAHEVGHIYLGHFRNKYITSEYFPPYLDVYANAFAAEILAPGHILCDDILSLYSDQRLAMQFGLSLEAFKIRYEPYRPVKIKIY